MDVLALRDNAKQELQQIRDIETGMEYLSKVRAIEVWAKAEKKDAELQNMIAEQKIRTQRVLGNLIREGQQRGELASQSEHGRGIQSASVTDGNTRKTLFDIGITRKESSIFKAIADIPEDVFDRAIEERKNAVDRAVTELTTTAMLKIANETKKQRRKDYLETPSIETSKKYRVFYADPPWMYNEVQHASEGNFHYKPLGVHYPSMTLEEIQALPIKQMSEDSAVLFLWVTSPFLEDSFSVIRAWGFSYKTSMVWDKVKHNVGNYVSVRHEFLLICTRGSCLPDVRKLHDSVQVEERTEHSKKPEVFRAIIDEIYPHGNRIELFAREAHDGWDSWGNEV